MLESIPIPNRFKLIFLEWIPTSAGMTYHLFSQLTHLTAIPDLLRPSEVFDVGGIGDPIGIRTMLNGINGLITRTLRKSLLLEIIFGMDIRSDFE